MLPRIKIQFSDFWDNLNPEDNYFTRLLRADFDVEISDRPDVLIYSCYRRWFTRYKCLRIFYTGENLRPDFRECDYALSFDRTNHPQHHRLPNYALSESTPDLLLQGLENPHRVLAAKKQFCAFVVSNPSCMRRNAFFEKLSRYKPVASGGMYRNNIGRSLKDWSEKFSFLREAKFTIAFENSSYPGYVTEKIYNALLNQSVPIYWGDPTVTKDFDPRCFINAHDFPDDESLIRHIAQVDKDDDLYCQLLVAAKFRDGRIPETVQPDRVRKFLADAIENREQIPLRAHSAYRHYTAAKTITYNTIHFVNRIESGLKRRLRISA